MPSACDQGSPTDLTLGASGPPVHLLDSTISGGTLPANGRIELSFDRLLLPACITSETFVLQEAQGTSVMTLVGYDPIARVVTITPTSALQLDTLYTLIITSPSSPTSVNGLRAIDLATLAPGEQSTFMFTAGDAGTAPALPPTIDFCNDILPLFVNKCQAGVCHGAVDQSLPDGLGLPAAGLSLTTNSGVQATAIGRVSQGSNTGPLAGVSEPPSLLFAEDVPIIDPGPTQAQATLDGGAPVVPGFGDPGHSWMIYKILMTDPAPCDPFSECDGAAPQVPVPYAPPDASGVYSVACDDGGSADCPQPLPEAERERLANLVLGLGMPFPPNPALTPEQYALTTGLPLTLNEREVLDFWIAEGAPVPATCP